jgi:hypothetical protein
MRLSVLLLLLILLAAPVQAQFSAGISTGLTGSGEAEWILPQFSAGVRLKPRWHILFRGSTWSSRHYLYYDTFGTRQQIGNTRHWHGQLGVLFVPISTRTLEFRLGLAAAGLHAETTITNPAFSSPDSKRSVWGTSLLFDFSAWVYKRRLSVDFTQSYTALQHHGNNFYPFYYSGRILDPFLLTGGFSWYWGKPVGFQTEMPDAANSQLALPKWSIGPTAEVAGYDAYGSEDLRYRFGVRSYRGFSTHGRLLLEATVLHETNTSGSYSYSRRYEQSEFVGGLGLEHVFGAQRRFGWVLGASTHLGISIRNSTQSSASYPTERTSNRYAVYEMRLRTCPRLALGQNWAVELPVGILFNDSDLGVAVLQSGIAIQRRLK